MDRGLDGRLILVTAPAGSGKTTVMAEWLARLARPVAWISLDQGDDDPARWLAYLLAAFQQAGVPVSQTHLDLVQASPAMLLGAMASLVNDLAVRDDDVVLAFDDYHVITNRAIHQAVTFLLDHAPRGLRLVIGTRADPPLPLARLRGRGQLVELRAAELAFTLDEATVFFDQVMGLSLAPGLIAALEQRTEGWIAGLQLAALSVRATSDPARFVATFTGSHRFLLDYLIEEVLERQPPDVTRFLLDTCILDRLCAPLCAAVTGQEDSQAMLEALEQANLFVVALDEERRWYRYHHLFADALRARVQHTQPQAVANLNARAAEWYANAGLIDEAIQHAVSAGELNRAAGLMEQAITARFHRSEWSTLAKWTNTLPDTILAGHPRLAIYLAAGLLYTGQAGAEHLLGLAEEALSRLTSDDRPVLEGELAAMQSFLAFLREDVEGTIRLGQRALTDLPKGHLILVQVLFAFGAAAWLDGDVERATHALREAYATAEAADNLYLMQVALAYLAQVRLLAGSVDEALALHQENVEIARQRQTGLHANGPLVGLGALLYERNDLDGAEQHLRQGLELARQEGNHLVSIGAAYYLARVRFSRGDVQEAHALLDEAGNLALQHSISWTWVTVSVASRQVHFWLRQGQGDRAQRWIAAIQRTEVARTHPRPRILAEADAIALARSALARGRFDEALRQVDLMLSAAEAGGRLAHVLELLVLRARVLAECGQSEHALASLERALALGARCGYVRTVIDEGDEILSLLSRLVANETATTPRSRAYAHQLLAAARTPSPSPASPADAIRQASPRSTLPEPLSEREMEVLRLIAAGASNQAIADTLFVTVHTVKKHTSNILGKLGVVSRTAAVARARDLDLL